MRLGAWDEVAAFALSLPGTELATSYGQPAIKIASNGRAFVNVGHEQDTSFVLQIDEATKLMLMDIDPGTFWETAHYANGPYVLVRFSASAPERVAEMIERAHEQAAARPSARPRKRKT